MELDDKIDIWKKKLLDMGKRNRLLNFKDTKSSTITIVSPASAALWDVFVQQEKSLSFSVSRSAEMDETGEDGANEYLPTESYSRNTDILPGDLTTDKSLKEQQTTLAKLHNKARLAMQEQGVNILYLAFGFLRWNEREDSDQYYEAPLLLVPASLSVADISSPFILSQHEDEIVANPTLAYKLEHDNGIILPDFNAEDGPEAYFSAVAKCVRGNHWTVSHAVKLALLSFLKINMYKDLERNRDKIQCNPIIRAIAGDKDALQYDLSDIDHYDHDANERPETTFQIVDADSTQQDAILCAEKGVSFVLQGPPGTGKSQTITNVIADCMANGKRVLFVSEKLAALEVVQRRLNEAGLADFCLVLHSSKANKKETLSQLENVLRVAGKRPHVDESAQLALSKLLSDREQLNAYDREVHTTVNPLGVSIYTVNGRLSQLTEYRDVIFAIPDIDQVDSQRFSAICSTVSAFAAVMGQNSDDYLLNPWHGAKVDDVTFELRHDISAVLPVLNQQVCALGSCIQQANERLHLRLSTAWQTYNADVAFLRLAANSPKAPAEWLRCDSFSSLFAAVAECTALQIEYRRNSELADTARKSVIELDRTGIFASDEDADIAPAQEISRVTDRMNATDYYRIWNAVDTDRQHLLSEAEENITAARTLRTALLDNFEKEIFYIDYNAIYKRFKTDYTSIFKIFDSQYKSDKNQIRGCLREAAKKISDQQAFDTVRKLRELAELRARREEADEKYAAAFGSLYTQESTDFDALKRAWKACDSLKTYLSARREQLRILAEMEAKEKSLRDDFALQNTDISTDWETVRRNLQWAQEMNAALQSVPHEDAFIDGICTDDDCISDCGKYSDEITHLAEAMQESRTWFQSLLDEETCRAFDAYESDNCSQRLTACIEKVAALEKWIDYRNACTACANIGLSEFVDKLKDSHTPASEVLPIFKKRFYRLWLDKIIPTFPAVSTFRRAVQEGRIDEFDQLDKMQFAIAQARIQAKVIESLPQVDRFTNGNDEVGILRRELGKQRKLMPTRMLFNKIPNLIMMLKPCLMMSPLSVSLFLESNAFQFDTVIFDEASQVCTEDAIGAICRGKQVILAGDSKQLPPTNFFKVSESDSELYDDDSDEEDDSGAYESILDEAALLPERTLLWHYRSRHEHLIAYSNAKIYKNRLVTFPSCVDAAPDYGVEYVYVKDGIYDRGGKRCNPVEASRVAALVFQHFEKFEESRTLGVIAFSEAQQQAIEAAIRRKRIEQPQYESFFAEDKHEAFFVKNLENVQGDERDTIIFSIGYAKTSAGKLPSSFGPLSRFGGERRLNVAITRAKFNVKLVGSILPTDIDTERLTTEGPKLLRGYIDFAIRGMEALDAEITSSDIVEHDSPFEESVYRFLDRKGYRLATQVGCSGYRIDMAVKHPSLSGRFVLGIECDGATYHSARTARERDRLRQAVLENMGWRIYRIWSTDWVKDPITEGAKLIEAVENAIRTYVETAPVGAKEETEPANEDYLTIEDVPVSEVLASNPYEFEEFSEIDYSGVSSVLSNGYIRMEDRIERIVECRFPIHCEQVYQLVAPYLGRTKATQLVKDNANFAIHNLVKAKKILQKGDFLYKYSFSQVPHYSSGNRPIKYISCDELASAMYSIAKTMIGPTKDTLLTETARAYGFARSGSKIGSALQDAFQLLLDNQQISVDEEKIYVTQTAS